jgi:hemolysin activation/secretion protein
MQGSALAAPPPSNASSTAVQQNLQQLQQLQQQTAAPKQQGNVVVTSPLTRADLPKAGGPRVLLKSVTFSPPSVFLSQAELDAITSKYVGQKVDFSQISALVRAVNDLYAAKGVVTASAILPPQKLTSGNLKVQLVEGRVGVVQVVGAHRTHDTYIFDRVHLDTQGVVDVPKAARDITWFNKTNQAQLRLLLQPGASFGLTNLSLGITEPAANMLQFFVDNEGVPSTGQLEFGAYYRGYDMLGVDDNLTLYGTLAGGSLAGTVSYDVPITTSGTRIAGSYTRSRIAVIEGPSEPLDITGNSQAGSLTLSQPVIATPNWTVLASLSGVYGTSTSDSAAVPLVDSETTKAAAGLDITYTGTGQTFSFDPQLIYANANDHLAGTSSDILLAAGTASGAFSLSKDFSVQATGAFQISNTSLLPGDLLFQIGGATTVRGYQADAVAGDSGYYAQFELHRELSEIANGLDAFAFADVGQVYSTFPSVTTLASVGVGASWNFNDRATAELSVGVPVVNAIADQPSAAVYARFIGRAF